MKALLLNLCTFLLLLSNGLADNWALLLAGSSGYSNYRHQADLAHANYYLHQSGFDMEKVIVMSFDDVPRNPENIYYNNLINMPEGPNKYRYMRVDYNKFDVSPETFYAVMDANISVLRNIGTGRYLDVKPDDSVLIFLVDHGSSQIFGMPVNDLYATELVDGLKRLKKRCKKVLILVEACESGSLFSNILNSTDEGIMAVTASNETESSYAIYLDEKRDAYLGDEFSTAFLEAVDRINQLDMTLETLFKIVKLETSDSAVKIYGDKKLLNEKVSSFIPTGINNVEQKPKKLLANKAKTHRIKSNQVQLERAKKTLAKNPKHKKAMFVLKHSEMITTLFKNFKQSMLLRNINVDQSPTGIHSKKQLQCYKSVTKHLFKMYSPASEIDATLPYLRYLNTACRAGISTDEIQRLLNMELIVLNL